MQKETYWHKLDNAAKVFPAISKKSRSNVFRLSFYLTSNINPDILNEAINISLKRFQVFNIQLKNGVFWNYFSENTKPFIVEQEPTEVCKYFKFTKNNGYLFKVYYYNNKITLETFHALTDGTGALEFLKSITYKYLVLMGNIIEHDNLILLEKPFSNKENEDSFNYNYDKTIKKQLKEEKAYHLKGDLFKNNWSLVYNMKIDTKEILSISKRYQATLTEYITTVIAYSIYQEGIGFQKNKNPIKMFIPVNLRPYFDSSSLRNFSLYIKSTFEPNRVWTFEEMLEVTKIEFSEQLHKDKLHERLGALVSLEKNKAVRFVPLVIKNLIFKIGYQILGDAINTSSLSNLGLIKLPADMKEHVTNVEFINNGKGINSTLVSYNGITNFSVNSEIKDVSIIKSILYKLVEDGAEITVNTNYKEGYDEIL